MENTGWTGFDPSTIDEDPETLTIQEKQTYLNRTSLQVLNQFNRIDYAGNIAHNLEKDRSTVRYHIDKLQYLNLIDFYRETQDRKYWKITDEGEAIKEKVSIPE